MATYHCQVRNGGVGYACAHADYISREGKYGSTKMKEQLVYTESGNMPEFAAGNARDYWKAADDFTRINGKTYYEIEAALPNELTHQENIELVHEFVNLEIGKDKAYTFAIHDKPAANDPSQSQVHVHIMFSNKMQDGIERSREKFFKQYYAKDPARQGARGDDRFNGKNQKGHAAIKEVRLSWEKIVNRAYEERGMEQRVSSKSLADQKAEALANGDKDKAYVLDRMPQVHLGPKLTYSTRREAIKAIDKVHYFMYEAHPKARHNFIACQQKETALAIVKLRKERILTLEENLENKGIVRSISDGINEKVLSAEASNDKAAAVKGLEKDIAQQKTLNAIELKTAKEELKSFKKEKENFLLSEKKIMQLANDIYTKGETKQLRLEAQSLSEIKAAWKENMAKCQAALKVQPENKELLQAKAKLLEAQKQIEARDIRLRDNISRMKARLENNKAKEAVHAIQNSIRERVEVARKRINDRQQRIDNLKTQKFVLDETRMNLHHSDALIKMRQNIGFAKEKNKLEIQKIKLIKNPMERRIALQEKMKELRVESSGINRKARGLGRYLIKKEYAYNAAKNVYTRGQYKKIGQIEKEIAKLQASITAQPNQDMSKEKALLDKLIMQNTARKENVAAMLSTTQAQRSIERMAQSRISRSQIVESRQMLLKEYADELKELKRDVMEIHDATVKEIQQIDVNKQAIDSGLNSVKAGLNIQEANVIGSIKANIGSDDPYRYKDKELVNDYER